MDGKYNEEEPMQTISILVRFKVKHNPATEGLSYFPSKGVPIKVEDGQLIMEI
jgi:hypothetical protein